jgi:hypothetical protein
MNGWAAVAYRIRLVSPPRGLRQDAARTPLLPFAVIVAGVGLG